MLVRSFLILIYFLFGFSVAHAGPSLVFNIDTGEILYDDEATTSWHPASLTKMMTAHLALKAIKQNKLTLNSPIIFSNYAASRPPSKLGVPVGHALLLHDALKIMLTRSMNDVATAIGEAVAGNETIFAQMMTQEAKSLGMNATRFINANGLHHDSQVTTARDMALLTMAIYKQHPEYLYLFGIKEVPYKNKVLKNTNRLINVYPGMNGMKTGYTCPSGFNIVATVKQGNQRYGVVIFGEHSVKARENKLLNLLSLNVATPKRGTFNVLTYGKHAERPAINNAIHICGPKPVIASKKTKIKNAPPKKVKAQENVKKIDKVKRF